MSKKIIFLSIISALLVLQFASAGYSDSYYHSYKSSSSNIYGSSYGVDYIKTKDYERTRTTTYLPYGGKEVQTHIIRTTREQPRRYYQDYYNQGNSCDRNYYGCPSNSDGYWRYQTNYRMNDYPVADSYSGNYYYKPQYDWHKGYYNWRY